VRIVKFHSFSDAIGGGSSSCSRHKSPNGQTDSLSSLIPGRQGNYQSRDNLKKQYDEMVLLRINNEGQKFL
jgi:hypothetical protein